MVTVLILYNSWFSTENIELVKVCLSLWSFVMEIKSNRVDIDNLPSFNHFPENMNSQSLSIAFYMNPFSEKWRENTWIIQLTVCAGKCWKIPDHHRSHTVFEICFFMIFLGILALSSFTHSPSTATEKLKFCRKTNIETILWKDNKGETKIENTSLFCQQPSFTRIRIYT